MKQKANRNFLAALTFLVLAALACSVLTSPQKPAAPFSTDVPTKKSDSSPVAPSQTANVAEEATAAPDAMPTSSATIDVISLSQGLDPLPSYRATFGMTVTAKDSNGKDTNGSAQVIQKTINTDKSQHSAITYSGIMGADSTQIGNMEIFLVANTTYMVTGDGSGKTSCSMFPAGSSPVKGLLVDPNDIIGEIHDARLVEKGVIVNGAKSDHYTFDKTNLTDSQFSQANGDVWVAQAGQYVVKLTGNAVGGNPFMITDPNASYTYDYSIDQAGTVAKILLPQECSGLPADIPIPATATLEAGFGGVYTLKSSDAPKIVADFFRKELPAQGWKAGDDTSAGEMFTMHFSKETRSLDILIMSDTNGTTIMLTTSQ